jgi:hypothetical protein
MQDVMASSPSAHLLRELKRLWNEPTTARCQRLSGNHQQGAQLDAWEDEGGASAPPGPASG